MARGPVEGPFAEGRGAVDEVMQTMADVVGLRDRAAGVLWRAACAADVDDELQVELIRSWLSGRGLAVDATVRSAEVTRRVVERVLTAPTSRGWLGSRRLRDHAAGTTDPLTATDASTWGSAHQVEAHLDAQRLAHEVASWPGRYRGRTWADRASAVLSAVVDAQAGDATGAWTDAGTELGVSRQAARQTGETMLARLRTFAGGA